MLREKSLRGFKSHPLRFSDFARARLFLLKRKRIFFCSVPPSKYSGGAAGLLRSGAAEGGLVFALPPAEPIGRKISSDFNQKVPHRNIKPARWVFYFCAVYSEYSSNEFSSSPACGGLGAGSAASPHSLTISSFSFGYF